MNRINVRTIEFKGKKIEVTADETGVVWIGDRQTSRPITAQGLTFVWGSERDGLPKGVKVALDAQAVAKIDDHSSAHRAEVAALAKKARDYDNTFNEGGEGFNPYR